MEKGIYLLGVCGVCFMMGCGDNTTFIENETILDTFTAAETGLVDLESMGYSDEELIQMAGGYYAANHDGFCPSFIVIDHETGDGEVYIWLYEEVDDLEDGVNQATHAATYAWYQVNRQTAKGVDGILLDDIDFLEPAD